MGSALMFEKMTAVKKLIAGAAALCGVFFLSCIGNKDVDEPLRVREALEIPLNFEMNLNDLAYDRVFDSVRAGIAAAIPDDPLGSDDLDTLTTELLGDDGILEYISSGNIEGFAGVIHDYVRKSMGENEKVKNVLERKDRLGDLVEIAGKAADELVRFREEKDERLSNITESTSPEIPATGDSLKLIDNPDISYECVLDNKRCPFSFEIYALFFKETMKPLIDRMTPDEFIHFTQDSDNYENVFGDDVVNLFYNDSDLENIKTELRVKAGEMPTMPPMSLNMVELLRDWFKGGKSPLGTRWVVKCLDEADEILKYLNTDEEYFIDVKLKVGVKFTLDMGTLFDL